MSASILGTGWVTPLGSGVDEVWERLTGGERATPGILKAEADGAPSYPAIKVPASALQNLPTHPRLRRASAISRFAAAAGLAAIDHAKRTGIELVPERTALIFAISNGGVIYTRRFYQEIVSSGAGSASPILFPETVFNAPASHLAALLGLSGPTYTLVGDGSVGLSALEMADRLLHERAIEFCLIVGAEEADWLLCDAYARWRLLRRSDNGSLSPGMILSEGAGAIVLGRERANTVRLNRTHAAVHVKTRAGLTNRITTLLEAFDPSKDAIVIGSANGTFIDAAEIAALERVIPQVPFYSPKPALGESVGAGGLWQTVVAVKALSEQQFPPMPATEKATEALGPRKFRAKTAVLLSCGLNQGLSAAELAI